MNIRNSQMELYAEQTISNIMTPDFVPREGSNSFSV